MSSKVKYLEDKQGTIIVLTHPVSKKLIGTIRPSGSGFIATNWRKDKQRFNHEPCAKGWLGACAVGDQINL